MRPSEPECGDRRARNEYTTVLLSGVRNSPLEKPAAFRRLLEEKTVVMPGAFNAAIGMLAESMGFEAIYISGAGIINGTTGYPDIALLGVEEVARAAAYIANAVGVPALCDADTGFGEALQVMRTVQVFEAAGVAGIHLEDQVMPKRCGHLAGKYCLPVEEAILKLKAALDARSDPDFFIIARTDAASAVGGGMADAIERSKRYADAGADASAKLFGRDVR